MLKRENPKNHDQLSILGFGCMRFPTKGTGIDEERSIAMIHEAINQGINYFDTAYPYHGGKSEPLLGKALAGGLREKVFIATKLPQYLVNSLEAAKKYFYSQLEKLQTDYIDYYLMHMFTDLASYEKMVNLGVIDWLASQKEAGVIRNFGFSFHGGKKDFEEIVRAYPWDFCQIQFNYMDENNQATIDGLRLAHELGMPVIIMEPLRGGRLAANLPKEVMKAFEGYPTKRTPAEWSFRWIWNHPEVTVVLSGMSDEEQLRENIQIASSAKANDFGPEEVAVFDKVKAVLTEKTKIPCTACNYCMPCPYGVNIPGNFAIYNDKYLLGHKSIKMKYMQNLGMLSKKPAFASQCVQCGKCEKHCPQHIEIRKELKTVKKELEGFYFKPLLFVIRKIARVGK